MRIAACVTAAVAGVAVATFAGGQAYAAQTRQPTKAELSAAVAAGVAQRWERVAAGQVFPAVVGYTTSLRTKETATRSASTRVQTPSRRSTALCSARPNATAASPASARTTPTSSPARSTRSASWSSRPPPKPTYSRQAADGRLPGHRAARARHPGTAAALFDDAARQAAAAQLAGPYVVLAVAATPTAGRERGRRAAGLGFRPDEPARVRVRRAAGQAGDDPLRHTEWPYGEAAKLQTASRASPTSRRRRRTRADPAERARHWTRSGPHGLAKHRGPASPSRSSTRHGRDRARPRGLGRAGPDYATARTRPASSRARARHLHRLANHRPPQRA